MVFSTTESSPGTPVPVSDILSAFWVDGSLGNYFSESRVTHLYGSQSLSGNIGESVFWCFHWCHAGMSGMGRKKIGRCRDDLGYLPVLGEFRPVFQGDGLQCTSAWCQ